MSDKNCATLVSMFVSSNSSGKFLKMSEDVLAHVSWNNTTIACKQCFRFIDGHLATMTTLTTNLTIKSEAKGKIQLKQNRAGTQHFLF